MHREDSQTFLRENDRIKPDIGNLLLSGVLLLRKSSSQPLLLTMEQPSIKMDGSGSASLSTHHTRKRRKRIFWNHSLQAKFLQAIDYLGIDSKDKSEISANDGHSQQPCQMQRR